MKDKLVQAVSEEIGISLEAHQADRAVSYLSAVSEANKHLNLTAARGEEDLLYKHFLDSLYLLKFYDLGKSESGKNEIKMLDLGTGAGFPGVPLKIRLEAMELHLLDSARRKINFLKYTLQSLKISGVRYLNGRAEDFSEQQKYRGQYPYICSRAVGKLPELLRLGMPFLKKEGLYFIYKGPQGGQELEEGKDLVDCWGAMVKGEHSYTLPGGETRKIYILQKS